MKTGNIALSILLVMLLTSMVWVNTELRAVYYNIDLTDKLRNYQSIEVDHYTVLKISGSNGYPIEILSSEETEVKVLRSRMSQFKYQMAGDTLIIDFAGARVSPSALAHSTTPAGIIISSSILKSLVLEDTHNRISGLDQHQLNLLLKGNSYTELSNNLLGTLSLQAEANSNFEFKHENASDTVLLALTGGSVGFLEGLSYHVFEPVLEDSALIVLSKNALRELMQNP
ncbi:MAG: hypothetical protein Roseis2KO_31570 [Roseivirga sp.]